MFKSCKTVDKIELQAWPSFLYHTLTSLSQGIILQTKGLNCLLIVDGGAEQNEGNLGDLRCERSSW